MAAIEALERNPSLASKDVDVWRIHLSVPHDVMRLCHNLLSQDEVQRAERFHFELDRRRFIVARGAMRQILGRYVNVAPQDLVFSYGAKGKPGVSPEFNEQGFQFNLSHSRELALLAVARGFGVGIDIEFVNHEFAGEEIAERFFSTKEVGVLRAIPPSERANAFFCCWTRKEAYIKALGEGLSVPLNSFDVAFGPGVSAALLQARVLPGQESRWSMYDMPVGREYTSALVAEGKNHRLRQWEWKAEF